MEENKVLITLDRYNELINAETQNEMIRTALFDGESVRLSYNKQHLLFEPNGYTVKCIYPFCYEQKLKSLTKENENV